jgi:hypothetical protein
VQGIEEPEWMPRYTLVLRQVPDGLYRRLKAVAAAHRRSMNQEAILALEDPQTRDDCLKSGTSESKQHPLSSSQYHGY